MVRKVDEDDLSEGGVHHLRGCEQRYGGDAAGTAFRNEGSETGVMRDASDAGTLKRVRELLREAAKTVGIDGGDNGLARELEGERGRLGLILMQDLHERGEYEEYVALGLELVSSYLQLGDIDNAGKTLSLCKKAFSFCGHDANYLTQKYERLYAAFVFRKKRRRRNSVAKRRQQKERRMLWRNEVTKRPLRRVWGTRRQMRPKRRRGWHLLHDRINRRVAEAEEGRYDRMQRASS